MGNRIISFILSSDCICTFIYLSAQAIWLCFSPFFYRLFFLLVDLAISLEQEIKKMNSMRSHDRQSNVIRILHQSCRCLMSLDFVGKIDKKSSVLTIYRDFEDMKNHHQIATFSSFNGFYRHWNDVISIGQNSWRRDRWWWWIIINSFDLDLVNIFFK